MLKIMHGSRSDPLTGRPIKSAEVLKSAIDIDSTNDISDNDTPTDLNDPSAEPRTTRLQAKSKSQDSTAADMYSFHTLVHKTHAYKRGAAPSSTAH